MLRSGIDPKDAREARKLLKKKGLARITSVFTAPETFFDTGRYAFVAVGTRT